MRPKPKPSSSGFKASLVLAIAALTVSPAAQTQAARSLYFVAIGEVRPGLVEHLVSYFDRAFDLKIEVLPALSLDSLAVDERRGQAVADELIVTVRRQYATLTRNPNARVIGITPRDMYNLSMQNQWIFAFSLRGKDQRFAVVSYARMDPVALGATPNEELLRSRLRKMVMKNIGVLYYDLPLSNDPRSAMYRNILGVDDLDRMTENFVVK